MASENKCSRCGETEFEEGAVQSAGTISFRPKGTKFLTMSPGNVSISARICMNCGLIELNGDIEVIKSLTGSKKS